MIIRSFTSICIAVAFFYILSALPAAATEDKGLEFEDTKGNTLTPADFMGKTLLLNFWATWCGPCISEMPSIMALQKKYRDKGLVVIPVSEDDNRSDAIQYFKENQVSAVSLYFDAGHKSFHMIKARGLPTTLLIDSKGNETKFIEGPLDIDSKEFRDSLEQVLQVN